MRTSDQKWSFWIDEDYWCLNIKRRKINVLAKPRLDAGYWVVPHVFLDDLTQFTEQSND